MSEIVSFCGLLCGDCEAFLATKSDDDEKRAEVATLWSRQYNADIKPQDVNCTGCTSGGDLHFSHCNVCEIRACGTGKGVVNCGYCDEYPCDKLTFIFKMVPDAKNRLDAARV